MPVNRKRKGSRPEKVSSAKKAKVTINPFEVRRNRKKHDVIGQKSTRDSTGRPGLSRSKAIDKVSAHEHFVMAQDIRRSSEITLHVVQYAVYCLDFELFWPNVTWSAKRVL